MYNNIENKMNKIDRLRTWKENDYFKALHEIYNKVIKMEQEGTHEIKKDDYYRLLEDYQSLNEECEELKQIEKRAKKEARKKVNKLWKEQDENPMKSFIVYVC